MRLLAGPLVTGAGQGDLYMYEQHYFIKGKSGFKQFLNLAAIFALSKGIIFFLEKCKKKPPNFIIRMPAKYLLQEPLPLN